MFQPESGEVGREIESTQEERVENPGEEMSDEAGSAAHADGAYEEEDLEERNVNEEQQSILSRIKEVLMSRAREALPSLKKCDKRTMMIETNKVNSVADYITTSNITACNGLLYAVAFVVSERLGKIGKQKSGDRNQMTEVWHNRTKLSERGKE